ncbi:MAG: hypothetical protein GH143_10865 [Calditrichaeota bacterium]|nr:hypothetical protein [Calditrichota bacterium]
MTNNQKPTLRDVFDYMLKVYKQSKLMVKDTVEALRDKTRCHFVHQKTWDYATRPNEHFLDGDSFGVSEAWVTYIPEGEIKLAVLMYFQFFSSKHFVDPALTYGSLNPGKMNGFDDIDRWAPYNTIYETERGEGKCVVRHDGPISIVTTSLEKHFHEAHLVKVPLESIRNIDDLHRIVVNPLTALIRGEVKEARKLLEEVETMQWPVIIAHEEDGNEDVEQI